LSAQQLGKQHQINEIGSSQFNSFEQWPDACQPSTARYQMFKRVMCVGTVKRFLKVFIYVRHYAAVLFDV
jgi:hypothetical protein